MAYLRQFVPDVLAAVRFAGGPRDGRPAAGRHHPGRAVRDQGPQGPRRRARRVPGATEIRAKPAMVMLMCPTGSLMGVPMARADCPLASAPVRFYADREAAGELLSG